VTARLTLRDTTERRGLLAYLERLLRLDPAASVRVQAGGSVAGIWGGPPMGAVTLRPVALAAPVQRLDRTVSAQRLSDSIAVAAAEPAVQDRAAARPDRVGEPAGGGLALELPPAIGGPAWAGLLPARGGWTWVATVPVGTVADAVRVGVDSFNRRVERLSPPGRTPAALEAIASEVWGRPVVADVPLRAAHAAQLAGLLGPEGEVSAHTSGTWRMLSCPGGSAAVRCDGSVGFGLDLAVWKLGGL
jgi:hypothetical protein